MKTKRISREASAGLNLNTAKSDLDWAQRHIEAGESIRALECMKMAMDQIESAQFKISKKPQKQQP